MKIIWDQVEIDQYSEERCGLYFEIFFLQICLKALLQDIAKVVWTFWQA